MILTVDIGNTTISFCGLAPAPGGDFHVRCAFRLDTAQGMPGADSLAAIRHALGDAGVEPEALEGAVLCSVVPALTDSVAECLARLLGKAPLVVLHTSRTGLTLAIPQPEYLGLDRLADAAWAAAHYPLPAVTVDMGTATTFNVIDRGGVFLGGAIAPGIATGLGALTARTAQLPEITLAQPEQVIGRDTVACMRSGVLVGAAAMIDGMTARIEKELGSPVTLLLTGGLCPYAEPLCEHPHVHEPALLAKGLGHIYNLNR